MHGQGILIVFAQRLNSPRFAESPFAIHPQTFLQHHKCHAASAIFCSGFKEANIITIDDALDKINKLRGVSYNKIHSISKQHIGLIGQELEKVFPELVETYSEREGFKDFKGVKYANLVAPLIEAIKELSKRNKLLNERISILENKFS